MRRSGLKRRTPLRQGAPLAPWEPLRRVPLKRKVPVQRSAAEPAPRAVKRSRRGRARVDLGTPTTPPPTRRGEILHHVVPESVQERAGGHPRDGRNLLAVNWNRHLTHHWSPRGNLLLTVLRDENFAYASALLGPGRAYNILRRHYDGEDPRLDALLTPAAGDRAATIEERDV